MGRRKFTSYIGVSAVFQQLRLRMGGAERFARRRQCRREQYSSNGRSCSARLNTHTSIARHQSRRRFSAHSNQSSYTTHQRRPVIRWNICPLSIRPTSRPAPGNDRHWCPVVARLLRFNPFTTADPVKALPFLPCWSNSPFLISDILALWRSVLSARAPECQKLKMAG